MESSSRATTTFQLVRGKHGRCLVYFGGYVYHKNKSCSNIHSRMYWKCSKSQALGCRARAQTLGNVIRTTGPGHNHPPSGDLKLMFNLADLQRINQTCRGCGNKYHLVKNILEHVKGVDCEYRYLFQCALCPHSSFRGFWKYPQSSDLGFACPNCGKRYKTLNYQRHHTKFECGKDFRFKSLAAKPLVERWWNFVSLARRGVTAAAVPDLATLAAAGAGVGFNPSAVMRKQRERRHGVVTATGSVVYPCEKCGKVYKHSVSKIRHTKFECGMEPMFKCQHCHYAAHQKSTLKNHVMNKHTRFQMVVFKPYQCPDCGNCFASRQSRYMHKKFKCGKETGEFSYKTAVLSGLFNDAPYTCSNCQKVYRYKKTLLLHLRYECGKEPQFQCPYCFYKCHQKGNLLTHMKTCKIYKQEICHMFTSYSKKKVRLLKLENIAKDVMPRKSSISRYGFPAPPQSHHDGVYHVCPQCSRSYKYSWNLTKHLKYECGKMPQFKCDRCGHRFHQKGNMKAHMRSCVGKNKFSQVTQ
ncbi:zinc finger protein 836-like [Ctenocephalides felis]|uniref:zinc finger protein 836-like n=1 Tax=Ctenocephalides felis TaxID=7515 RepID=UPI000E6E2CFD|nr:zinc finger protein 836-like [Ctenocephalides felis]